MQNALHNPAVCVEYSTNLAQTYYEMHNSMARGNATDFNIMHTINNQLTALVIEAGKQIFLTATIHRIQKQQEALVGVMTNSEQDRVANDIKTISKIVPSVDEVPKVNPDASRPSVDGGTKVSLKLVDINQLHPEPNAAQ